MGQPYSPWPQSPGQQSPGPQPSGQPQYSEAAHQPKRPGFGSRVGKILLRRLIGYGIGLVVVLGFGGVATMCGKESKKHDQSNVTFATVGQCLRVDDFASYKPKFARVDCADPDATVIRVATRGDCGNGGYIEYTEGKDKACLARQLQDGQCYNLPKFKGEWRKVDCSAARIGSDGYKVKKINGKNDPDPSECEGGDTVYNYPDPMVTYCLTRGPGIKP